MTVRTRSCLIAAHLVVMCAITASPASAGRGTPTVPPQVLDDAEVHILSDTVGGADVLPTTRTVPHWFGSTLNPHNGVTYGYNIVGADPDNCSASSCSVTIEVDITPIIVNIDGMTFSGSDVLAAVLASPQFALNDYGATPFVSGSPELFGPREAGGVLSQGNAGLGLQLLDAIMKSQFNKTGGNHYRLILHPNVLPPVTIDIPNNLGRLVQTARGNIFPAVDIGWWKARIHNLATNADPTHLALYLTDDVVMYEGNKAFFCCFQGFHGAKAVGGGFGSSNSNGSAPVQTFAWASYVSPGVSARPNGGRSWTVQDIWAVSHEIAEWANDPFVNNTVERWQFPFLPGVFCSDLLETADPVSPIGFAVGTNTFRQGPNPDGSQSADGYYHPQDEAFIPWFMRQSPNTQSEPTQTPSANLGRYTFMGY